MIHLLMLSVSLFAATQTSPVSKTVIKLNNPSPILMADKLHVSMFKHSFFYAVGPAIISYFKIPETIVIFSSQDYSPTSAAEYARSHFKADSYSLSVSP